MAYIAHTHTHTHIYTHTHAKEINNCQRKRVVQNNLNSFSVGDFEGELRKSLLSQGKGLSEKFNTEPIITLGGPGFQIALMIQL